MTEDACILTASDMRKIKDVLDQEGSIESIDSILKEAEERQQLQTTEVIK